MGERERNEIKKSEGLNLIMKIFFVSLDEMGKKLVKQKWQRKTLGANLNIGFFLQVKEGKIFAEETYFMKLSYEHEIFMRILKEN